MVEKMCIVAMGINLILHNYNEGNFKMAILWGSTTAIFLSELIMEVL